MMERYGHLLGHLADELVEAAPADFSARDYAGVALTAGVDLGIALALDTPERARRLAAVYDSDAGLTDPRAVAEKAATLRLLRRLIDGDA